MPDPTFRGLLNTSLTRRFHKHTFDIDIRGPEGIGSFTSRGESALIPLSCTTPGRQIGTDEKTIWGPVYNIPYSRIYDGDFELTCMYDQSFERYIRNWMDSIITSPGERANYYDNIIGEISITVYGESYRQGVQNKYTLYNLYEVFPKTINGLDLDTASQNEFQTMTISFAYREFATLLKGDEDTQN